MTAPLRHATLESMQLVSVPWHEVPPGAGRPPSARARELNWADLLEVQYTISLFFRRPGYAVLYKYCTASSEPVHLGPYATLGELTRAEQPVCVPTVFLPYSLP
jgi:hypothetical protein